jgi:HD superfamily phosphodiesterase
LWDLGLVEVSVQDFVGGFVEGKEAAQLAAGLESLLDLDVLDDAVLPLRFEFEVEGLHEVDHLLEKDRFVGESSVVLQFDAQLQLFLLRQRKRTLACEVVDHFGEG